MTRYLTPSQFLMAEKLNISPEEYAKYSLNPPLKRKPKKVGLWVMIDNYRGEKTSLLVTPTANGLSVTQGAPSDRSK